MKKITEYFRNAKLNIKFTIIIVLFTVVPLCISIGALFHIMMQNVIDENISYMQYTMERNSDNMATRIDSVNMSTQFFLSDDSLKQVLNASVSGEELSTEDWLKFKNMEVSSLERLVNNNPLLYSVRVYAVNDQVQEMMPILYSRKRMEKQSWAEKENYTGWNYNYTDNIFSSYTMDQNRKIMSLITQVEDRNNGTIGVIEAAMTAANDFF